MRRCLNDDVAVSLEKFTRARQLVASGLTMREATARVQVGKFALYAVLRNDGVMMQTESCVGSHRWLATMQQT